MFARMFKLGVTALGACALAGGTATAATGPPPPPKAAGGQTVTTLASNLETPTSFAAGDGAVFEGDAGNLQSSGPPAGGVFVLRGGSGTELPGSPQYVAGLAWHKGALYVSGGSFTGPTTAKFQLLKWSGWNGTTFTKQKAIYTAPKNFQGFDGIAFGPDGRLYAGTSVSGTNNNDHGPAKTPYVYDILSFNANGGGLKIFAKGMRQPWQLAFPGASKVPFVSDLSQDTGKASNSPDFLLKVHKGDNYGFPKCTHFHKSKCPSFAKPYKFLPPHWDPMGLAIIGKKLYITSFTGPKAKGDGEVFSMPLKGGKLSPFLTGFSSPIVGLGANGKTLFVGAATGQAFSVKP